MKLFAHTEKVALLKVELVELAVSLYVIIVVVLPVPWRVMYGLFDGIDTFSLHKPQAQSFETLKLQSKYLIGFHVSST